VYRLPLGRYIGKETNLAGQMCTASQQTPPTAPTVIAE